MYIITLDFGKWKQKKITSSTTKTLIQYERIELLNHWTPLCERSIYNEDKERRNIRLIGDVSIVMMIGFFVIQLYLALRGNIVSYGGAFVALVCGYSIWKTNKTALFT